MPKTFFFVICKCLREPTNEKTLPVSILFLPKKENENTFEWIMDYSLL